MTEEEYRKSQIDIEHRRYLLDERTFEHAQRFWHRNLATVITAIVSFAAIFVSVTQIAMDHERTRRQDEATAKREQERIDDQRTQRDKDRESANAAEMRAFRMEIGKFVLEHKAHIQSGNAQTRESVRQLMLAIFPTEIVIPVFERLRVAAPNESETWAIGVQTAQRLQPEIKFEVANVDDQIDIRVNGKSIYRGGAVKSVSANLQPGENAVEIDLFNKASHRGGGLMGLVARKKEGWYYSATLTMPDGNTLSFSKRNDNPTSSQFGYWFRVEAIRLQVDPTTGVVTKL